MVSDSGVITNRQIWNISYPIFFGLLAQNIINVTDTAFLGRVGEVELGASAMGGLYYICIFTIAFGFSTGSQILIARRNGEKNYAEVGPVMIQGCAFLLVMAALLFGLSLLFAGDIMRMLISSDDIWNATVRFLNWRVIGFFFVFLGVMFRAFFVGITRTKVLTLNAIVMAITNIVLDYLLIFGKFGFPKLGLEGAAIASVIAEAVSILFYFIYTRLTVDSEKYGLTRFRSFDIDLLKRVLNISIFTMLQYFISLSTYFILFIAVEHLGQRSLAVANIVRSLYVMMLIPINALAMTTNTLVSNCLGADRADNVLPVIKHITYLSVGVTVVFVGVLCLFPKAVLSIYTNDMELIEASVSTFFIVALAMPIAAMANIVFNGLIGTGNTQVAFIIEVVTLIFYTLFIFVAAFRMKLPVSLCFLTETIYYVGLFLFSIIYLLKGNWRNKVL